MKELLPKIGLLTGSFVLFLILSEILLGFAGFSYYPIDIDVNISEKDRVFRLNLTSGYYETAEEKRIEHLPEENLVYKFEYQKFKSEKPPDTYRIFVLGGSSVYLLAYSDYHTEYAKNLFENLYQNKKIEIIFLGGGGCGTYELTKINQEVLEYEPNLVILYSGHNEFLFPSSKKYYAEKRDLTGKINENLEKLRIYQFLSGIIIPFKNDVVEITENLNLGMFDNQTEKQMIYESYRLNIDNMIKMAKNKNVNFMLSTLSYNHMSPPISIGYLMETLPGMGLSMEDFGSSTVNFSREKIERVLDEIIEQGNIETGDIPSLDEYKIGLKYYEMGDYEKAREHFEKGILIEIYPQRANNITNKIVRELAKEYNIPLADVESAVLEETERGITTYELLSDHCHLKKKGNEILLETLFETIKENNLVW
jgi:tetratricopeptide (TPR) repeat protein